MVRISGFPAHWTSVHACFSPCGNYLCIYGRISDFYQGVCVYSTGTLKKMKSCILESNSDIELVVFDKYTDIWIYMAGWHKASLRDHIFHFEKQTKRKFSNQEPDYSKWIELYPDEKFVRVHQDILGTKAVLETQVYTVVDCHKYTSRRYRVLKLDGNTVQEVKTSLFPVRSGDLIPLDSYLTPDSRKFVSVYSNGVIDIHLL